MAKRRRRKPIRIKKANRGKFKATMRRTGKSASQLRRSKNKLTRKRAVFAINARKWKKKGRRRKKRK